MKIYVGRSRNFDFEKELYESLRKSGLNDLCGFCLTARERQGILRQQDRPEGGRLYVRGSFTPVYRLR